MNTHQFNGFTERVPAVNTDRNYNVLSGDLAEKVLRRANNAFRMQFPGFPGLEDTLCLVETPNGKELAGSNLPVLAAMNSVDLKDLGIQVCDERDLARVYNDEVQRLAYGKEGFFYNRFWCDLALIRNPSASQTDLKPWEQELDAEINRVSGINPDQIVSVPYRALVPAFAVRDNSPFGEVRANSFKLSPERRDAVKVLPITSAEAREGYIFLRLDEATGFPVKSATGGRFYGLSQSRRFSRLYLLGGLSVNANYAGLANSGEGGRVVFRTAEGSAQK